MSGPSGRPRFPTTDPATGAAGRVYEGHTLDEARAMLARAHAAQNAWRRTGFGERSRLMHRAADVLRERAADFAERLAAEMGKPLADGRAEIDKCAFHCDHYADHAERYLVREPVELGGPRAFVTFNPLGRGAGDHAAELPVLAGVSLRRAGADGRQRGRAQARLQRARLRAGHRGGVPAGGLCRAPVRHGARAQPRHRRAEEVFGPVAAIIAARDEADAIRIANDSEFGLGSGVLTTDLARGERIAAAELDAGMAFVNDNVRSDPRMPFGGIKHSGFGRECGAYGIREFVNVKTVCVKCRRHQAVLPPNHLQQISPLPPQPRAWRRRDHPRSGIPSMGDSQFVATGGKSSFPCLKPLRPVISHSSNASRLGPSTAVFAATLLGRPKSCIPVAPTWRVSIHSS